MPVAGGQYLPISLSLSISLFMIMIMIMHYLIIVQSAICTRGVDFNTHQCLSYYHATTANATTNAIAMTTSLPVWATREVAGSQKF